MYTRALTKALISGPAAVAGARRASRQGRQRHFFAIYALQYIYFEVSISMYNIYMYIYTLPGVYNIYIYVYIHIYEYIYTKVPLRNAGSVKSRG